MDIYLAFNIDFENYVAQLTTLQKENYQRDSPSVCSILQNKVCLKYFTIENEKRKASLYIKALRVWGEHCL
ncbi:MAG: hypothetical protein GW789_03150 [Ignavibacteria bacterium]|nr:hypothetical protein [Ignavibacteria bacterium]